MIAVTTAQNVELAGIYRCYSCEDSEVVLRGGDTAPECGKCHRPVTWEYRLQMGCRRELPLA